MNKIKVCTINVPTRKDVEVGKTLPFCELFQFRLAFKRIVQLYNAARRAAARGSVSRVSFNVYLMIF